MTATTLLTVAVILQHPAAAAKLHTAAAHQHPRHLSQAAQHHPSTAVEHLRIIPIHLFAAANLFLAATANQTSQKHPAAVTGSLRLQA